MLNAVDQEESESDSTDSASEEIEAPKNGKAQNKISDYERLRMKRIEENRARMEALGLKKMANSLVGSLPKQAKKMSDKRKGKRKVDKDGDDDDYKPSEEEEDLVSSSEDDIDEEFSGSRTKKAKTKIRTPNKQISFEKPPSNLNYVDDDKDLMQAIALSLQDSAGFIDVNNLASQSSTAPPIDSKRKGDIQEDTGKRNRKKSINNRVQMTEDELIVHFFQIDEAGKGSITLRDLRKMAAAHDFTWSDKEMADMIHYFDNDGDGKLSLDDFHKIAGRCNIIQSLETTVMDKA